MTAASLGTTTRPVSGARHLSEILRRIDRRSYRAYKDIAGAYDLGLGQLHIDHVQGDPFAAPSKVRFRISMNRAKLPADWFRNRPRRTALCDYLARRVRSAIYEHAQGHRGSGKSGAIQIDAGGQEVLERTAVILTDDWVEARLSVGLPAAGRSVLGRQAETMLLEELVVIAERGLTAEHLDSADVDGFIRTIEAQEEIRSELASAGLVAFVADGSILPRQTGASERPLAQAVPWGSPDALRVDFTPTALGRTITGTGIPRGVTLIVGGGYHGKSTLLRALDRGVYPHVPGDGREFVVTTPNAVKIRAEDGRRVEAVDISPFISNLPHGRSPEKFSSDDASGSTSQAASIIEALEAGASTLLLDEDTSATNFMIRDARMQALVHREHEPITPFVDQVRALYEQLGVSTVLVMGGSGDYFDVADTVLMMRSFEAHDVTETAKSVATRIQTHRHPEAGTSIALPPPRCPEPRSLDASRGKKSAKIDVRRTDHVVFGSTDLELRGVEQLVDPSQTRAVAHALLLIRADANGRKPLSELLDAVEEIFDNEGLDPLDPFHRAGRHPGNYARPRRLEIAAALNRLRILQVKRRDA